MIRRAVPGDAASLARLIELIWHDDKPSADPIARASSDTNRATFVFDDGKIAGFVDAFSTISAEGVCRWEVDLLGVRADVQGKGFGRALVAAALEAGRDFGATMAQALVRTDNAAALKTFMRCGFAVDDAIQGLYVSDRDVDERLPTPTGACLLSVMTLTYSGVWVEGDWSAETLHYAQAVRTRYRWDVAGAVIPTGRGSAAETGYDLAGQYHWLRLEY